MDAAAANVQEMVHPVLAAVPPQAVAGSIPVTVVDGSRTRFPGAYQNVDIVSMFFNMKAELQRQGTQLQSHEMRIHNLEQESACHEMRIHNLEQESAHQQRQLNVLHQIPTLKCPTCQESRSLNILICGHLMCDTCISDLADNQYPFAHEDNGFVRNPNTLSPCNVLRR